MWLLDVFFSEMDASVYFRWADTVITKLFITATKTI